MNRKVNQTAIIGLLLLVAAFFTYLNFYSDMGILMAIIGGVLLIAGLLSGNN